MKRFFLFMVIFGLAFAGIQKVEAQEVEAVTVAAPAAVKTLNIPCVKVEECENAEVKCMNPKVTFYNVNLKEYPLSEAKKKELNLNSQEVSFWELANATPLEQANTATCGIWNEKTFDFDSCEGYFKFSRDMEGKDVFGFFWIQYPKIPISPIVSQSTVELDFNSRISQEVRIDIHNRTNDPSYKVIKDLSYTVTDATKVIEVTDGKEAEITSGESRKFTSDAKAENFNVTLKFSSPGVKTVNISGTDALCGAYTDTKTITVKDPCDEISPPSISNLKATAVKQVVTVSFGANPNITKASYTTSDGTPGGDFTDIGKGNFEAKLNFSTSGKKTITVNAVNSCQKKASQSVDVLVCGDNIGFSIDGNKVYFGEEKNKVSASGSDPTLNRVASDLVFFDLNRTITTHEGGTKQLISFDYTLDPSSTKIKVRIIDNFHEFLNPLDEFEVQTSGSYSKAIIPYNRLYDILYLGIYDILIEASISGVSDDQCQTYRKVFSVQFQRP